MRFRRIGAIAAGAGLLVTVAMAVPAHATTDYDPPPTYQANDYAGGQAMAILPAGENGLVNASQYAEYQATGARPANSQDQLAPYEDLPYGLSGLSDSGLSSYYDDESFGIPAGDITRTEQPSPDVVIYRDTHDVPHIYGRTDEAMAFGAGYAQAEDRLFLMDVLRHYGEGTTSAFLGPSCADEEMDHNQLLLAAYTKKQATAQVNDLPKEYGAEGLAAKKLIDSYVQGINAYIAATTTDPSLLPAEYPTATGGLPQPWTPADVVAVAGLIGGIFGDGGGDEVANAALLQYLDTQLGSTDGPQAFTALKEQNDPDAPTTIVDKSFPYEQPGTIDTALTAMPDNAAAALTGGPTDTTADCDATPADGAALTDVANLLRVPKHMSNALVVSAQDSATGHPLAVFGPQVSYFAPQILMQEDLHSPDYDAEGASFPGTGLVELGRGEDFAWSATSSGTDITDQRLELICNPKGGKPAAQGKYYEYDGKCLKMVSEQFKETAVTKPGGTGAPVTIDHHIYLTVHGIVQGWTTADGGKPVAVVNQRSTYGHDVDSVIGFLSWGEPAVTDSVQTWMAGAAQIEFTFNWFYVDDKDIGYYSSGLDPVRPSDVDPNLPTWGTGDAEWTGFLPASAHPQEIDPPQGFFDSWNNKPAPGFSASDSQYGYGPVYRNQMLTAQIEDQLAATGDQLTEADLVTAMSTASTQDLDGITVLPELLSEVAGRAEPAGVESMLSALSAWSASGAHRMGTSPTATTYLQQDAIVAMDQVEPALIRAFFDPLFLAGGLTQNGGAPDSSYAGGSAGYAKVPMGFVNEPDNGGAHLGSAYDGGWEGTMVKLLRQMQGQAVAQPFPPAITDSLCSGGLSTCAATVDATLLSVYDELVADNGTSTVADWSTDDELQAAGETLVQYDAIAFRSVGLVGQPDINWQNRPTFQQVVSFPSHRA